MPNGARSDLYVRMLAGERICRCFRGASNFRSRSAWTKIRIAVKVINHLGDEVMKVFRVD